PREVARERRRVARACGPRRRHRRDLRAGGGGGRLGRPGPCGPPVPGRRRGGGAVGPRMTAPTDHDVLVELNEDLYAAFENADLDRMDALWADGGLADTVVCVHPGWPSLRG